MNLSVYQCITVQQLRIGSVSNSSVLQIGTSGSIKALTHVYNSGGVEGADSTDAVEEDKAPPMVPLPEPILSIQSA